ncbi:hypothetical protein ACHAW5_006584 [Stephanodiscus triporus]|uniref:PIH1 domain-containing protein 1 n=1 Tax=Stephanodiscus triporus TaxID=2934178 RepID=A0ABD3R0G7_9STRA
MRNDDAISEEEVRRLENAFGDDAFCKLMAEYATELSDPKYKAEQEAYLALLETRNELPLGKALVWPSSGFVVKCIHQKKRGTGSDDGGSKLFLNIVYADRVARPVMNDSGQHRPGGSSWSVPYALGPLRMERDKSGMNLVPAFDCCFHPLTLRYAHARRGFLDLVIDIAKNAVSKAFGASGDGVEILDGYTILRGVSYKSGMPRALMIGIDTHEDATVSQRERKSMFEESDEAGSLPLHIAVSGESLLRQIDPSRMTVTGRDEERAEDGSTVENDAQMDQAMDGVVRADDLVQTIEPRDWSLVEITRSGVHNAGVRVPKYKIVERRAFDIAEHTTTTTTSDIPTTQRPSHLIVTIYLDGATTKTLAAVDINLDVRERELKIISDSKCGYRLEVALPYRVNPKRGDASFDRKRSTLIVTLPVV